MPRFSPAEWRDGGRGPSRAFTADQFMEHLAHWEDEGTDKPETKWLEAMTDEQYDGARSNRH